MKISTTLSRLILLALLLIPKLDLAQNHTIKAKGTQIQMSYALKTVFNQAEAVYIPSGFTMDAIYNDAPDMAPLFLGLIMQRQKIDMDQKRNINHLDNYFAIQDEILTFIGHLAKAHNYINPVDGSKLSLIQMHKDFESALNGDYNNVYINKFGINPTTTNVAYILDQPTSSNTGTTNIEPNANIDLREEAPTEINIFGEVSPYAMSGPEINEWQNASGNSNIEGLVCPEKNQSPNTYFFDIDTNNIPNDGTDVRCTYFGKDGPLHEQWSNVNNKRHGVSIIYSMSKNVRYLSHKNIYANGKKHGVQEFYINKKGRHYLAIQETYANGKREGVTKHWSDNFGSPNISLQSVANYSNDKLNGIKESYSMSSSTGQPYLQSRTSYANGKKNGEEIKYSESGKVDRKDNYKNGKRHGEQINYNPPTIYSRYVNNQPQAIQCISIYDNGVEITEKCWDSKGNIVKY